MKHRLIVRRCRTVSGWEDLNLRPHGPEPCALELLFYFFQSQQVIIIRPLTSEAFYNHYPNQFKQSRNNNWSYPAWHNQEAVTLNACLLHFVKDGLEIFPMYNDFFDDDENWAIIKLSAGSISPLGPQDITFWASDDKKAGLRRSVFCLSVSVRSVGNSD